MAAVYAILVYSLILMVVCFYKDGSSYSCGIEPIDIVLAGPVMWVVYGILNIPVPQKLVRRIIEGKEQKREKRTFSDREIRRVVYGFVVAEKKHFGDDLYRLDRYNNDDYYKWYGIDSLCWHKARYERRNKRFMEVLLKHPEQTKKEFAKYFELMDEEKLRADGWHDWDLHELARMELWKYKGAK